jgi:hypothetical protein
VSKRAWGPIVPREGHVLAVEIDLEHAVDRLAGCGQLIERGFEQALLQAAADIGKKNDEAGMQCRGRIGSPGSWRKVADIWADRPGG